MSKRKAAHALLITLLGLLAYSNTIHAPFQWDRSYITENPAVKDASYFLRLSDLSGYSHYEALKHRYVGYLSFALNYRLHGESVAGYHAVNLTIHLLCALLLYRLVSLTLRAGFIGGSVAEGAAGYIALFSGLLFVAHPVQTEAVTFIFQRLASLAAFFYLGSLFFYAKWRLSPRSRRSLAFYLLSLVSAALAMKTKENAFTLPLMALLYEFFFLRKNLPSRPSYAALAPFALVMLIVPLGAGAGVLKTLDLNYFYTQIRVAATYIRLLFLPVAQNLDYDYPLYRSFFAPAVFLSFLFHLCVAALGFYLFFRSRRRPLLRLASFGIFWFYIALSVESSLIPLPTLIDEYRLYLPSAGAFMFAVAGFFALLGDDGSEKPRALVALGIITVILAVAAHERNSLWTSQTRLWQDVVKKSPRKPRGHYNLGMAYMREERFADAVAELKVAAELAPDDAKIYNNLGMVFRSWGLRDDAFDAFREAASLGPDLPEARFNFGLALIERGLLEEAGREFEATLRTAPGHREARRFLDYLNEEDK